MRILKFTIWLAGFLFTSISLAEVPVIDAYQDTTSTQASSSITNNSNISSIKPSIAPIASPALGGMPVDQRITVLERQVANLSQLLTQFNDLQQQVQDLRGKLEVQKHDLQVLQEQVRSQYQDLEQRLNAGKAAATNNSMPKATNVASATKNDSSANDAAVSPTTINDTATADNSEAPYQAAFDLLKKKKYPQTITAFQNFIKKYPNSKQIGNARYWLGMVYLTQGQPEQAVPQFQTLIKKNPQDAKIPDAILQLGMAYYATGDTKRAIATLKSVEEKYPESSAAKYAKGRLQQIQPTAPANGAA